MLGLMELSPCKSKNRIMNKKTFVKAALVFMGLVALAVGNALLLSPVSFESSAGIILNADASLLSEFRAYGGLILAAGIVISLGAFQIKWRYFSIWFSILFYFGIALARILSIALDGMPSDLLVIVAAFELALGLLGLLMLRLNRDQQQAEVNTALA